MPVGTQLADAPKPAASSEAAVSTPSRRHCGLRVTTTLRRPGSTRPALTPEQRANRPPSVHPVFLTHPISGRKVLYANPGYTIRINELPEDESDAVLDQLFAHQLQPKYQYAHVWTEGDVLVWDHIGTLHNAIPDYTADEHRLIKRCQVMADRVFDPAFLKSAMMATAAE